MRDAGTGNAPRPRIMIHIDRGGDKIRTRDFFDKLNSYGAEYDVIGQSYYPWWQGSLNDLRENLIFTAERYKKDIFVVEAAYNWKPAEYKTKPGPVSRIPRRSKAVSGRSKSNCAGNSRRPRQRSVLVGTRRNRDPGFSKFFR